MSEPVRLPAVPAPLTWWNTPAYHVVEGPDRLVVGAGPNTDVFGDPGGPTRTANAPALLAALDGEFTLGARVEPDFRATYDAGVLFLYVDEDNHAKLCLELSPQGRPTIVSVVTRGGVSDDCNSFTVDGGGVRLRITRTGGAYAFHADTGDGFWHLVRYFALDGSPRAGFLAQSPLGEGQTVRFSEITHTTTPPEDLRGGK
ncbi:DUF1349 domain-containing protein [Thermobifida halotolerans]|uniref:DUF1349 domain-containing protein n=1 Tax=Thermobifida halotolerans TaxID=483545 RepID=A0A399G177_9ACTN|nr:DUF1349 domain-containing protein [Thermobifida halotolerans]UOE17887.1 DUF1349 domain-containing protein [Thermobifida halotolerans]